MLSFLFLTPKLPFNGKVECLEDRFHHISKDANHFFSKNLDEGALLMQASSLIIDGTFISIALYW